MRVHNFLVGEIMLSSFFKRVTSNNEHQFLPDLPVALQHEHFQLYVEIHLKATAASSRSAWMAFLSSVECSQDPVPEFDFTTTLTHV